MGENSQDLNIPVHIGFIMDGNRRWAKKNGQPAIFGHKKGAATLEQIINKLGESGVKYATFFAFSSENWQRSTEEVEGLMLLFLEMLNKKSDMLHQMGARVNIIGRKNDFSPEIQVEIKKLEDLTKNNTKITTNFALSYGGKAEIVDIIRRLVEEKVATDQVTEKMIQERIYEVGQPDPDLIIRTGGEKRLSGFMLWQSTYAELYFSDTLWPDFNELELTKALDWFKDIKRNFGK